MTAGLLVIGGNPEIGLKQDQTEGCREQQQKASGAQKKLLCGFAGFDLYSAITL
jgi:hypothetical protein